jgi:hypothetical protein
MSNLTYILEWLSNSIEKYEKKNFLEESIKRIRVGKLVFGHRYMDLKYIFLRLLNKLFTMVLKD